MITSQPCNGIKRRPTMSKDTLIPPVADAAQAAALDLHVGRRIRELRNARGVSQSRLGRQLGVTFSQVQKYEMGANRIGAGRLFLTATFLGVPVDFLFEGAGSLNETIGRSAPTSSELSILTDAFLAIADGERASVLALVCSLAKYPASGSLSD